MPQSSKVAKTKPQFGVLPLSHSISIFNQCIDIFGSECLRGSNFPPYMPIDAEAFDAEDQHVALKAYTALLNAADDSDARINKLRAKLEAYFGPLNQPFIARLRGFNFGIVPKASLH
jgi:hypothetical protein